MENDELRKNLEAAMHSKIDPRSIETQVEPQDKIEVQTKVKTSKPRRCVNCTCRRSKSKDSKEKKPMANEDEAVIPPRGGCGSCALGDAFRCDGCPHRGKPAFKEGEVFKFDDELNDL